MKAAGLLKCSVPTGPHSEQIELHHSHVEFAYQNGVDVPKLNELLGLHLDDEAFKDWIESPENLEPLCSLHHRGAEAVHSLPTPIWNVVRVWKDDIVPPAEVTPAGSHQ
jgi:hypothetical protein